MNCPADTKNAINRIRPESVATELSVWPVPSERGPINGTQEGDGQTLRVSENPLVGRVCYPPLPPHREGRIANPTHVLSLTRRRSASW